MDYFLDVVDILCLVFIVAIFIRSILSWFNLRPDNPLVVAANFITEPILAPLSRIVPRVGMFDFTPSVAILLLLLIRVLIRYV
jgi:YggT family protein